MQINSLLCALAPTPLKISPLYIYKTPTTSAGQNTYFHNKTIMYLSSMNNVHIIHGIQYLQNIKYNTSLLRYVSSSVVCCTMAGFHCCAISLESKGLENNLCLDTHIKNQNLSLNFEERFQVHCHQLPALTGIFSSASHPMTRRLWKNTRGRWIAKLGSSIIFLLAHFR